MPTESLKPQNIDTSVEHSVIDAFHRCVNAAPAACATVHESVELSYSELRDYAGRIAEQLVQMGLSREQTVGLCLDRSHHAIAAMLGSWLADGAFVPLDPEYPDERLRYMVEDAQVQIIISSEKYADLFTHSGTDILLLDQNSPFSLPEANPDALHCPAPEQLAYIMYTSGSTGMPKGVPIEHGALLNYCNADAEVYELSATDRTLQFSTINFDIAIEEIFPPLITGGAVVIRPLERMEAQIELSALVEKYAISAIHLATGYWHEWVDLMVAAQVQAPASIRLMVVTGEKVSAAHYQRWR
ncbi:MAG: AMP-binding protein, partial [Granulosicoccaceae bacterium]